MIAVWALCAKPAIERNSVNQDQSVRCRRTRSDRSWPKPADRKAKCIASHIDPPFPQLNMRFRDKRAATRRRAASAMAIWPRSSALSPVSAEDASFNAAVIVSRMSDRSVAVLSRLLDTWVMIVSAGGRPSGPELCVSDLQVQPHPIQAIIREPSLRLVAKGGIEPPTHGFSV